MSNNALITFKAGRCTIDGGKIVSQPEPGYIYLYSDDLPHFCWRPRNRPGTDPVLDLTMVPTDGSFVPLVKEEGAEELHSPTNGRIYKLQFESSSQKYYFYLQSRSQHANGDPSWWSQRDQRLGQIVSTILQGEEVDVHGEMAEFSGGSGEGGPRRPYADDDDMDVDEDPSTGGAGAGATGGDPRQEGELSREGGADGGRA